jgi:predicted HTH transcriptional regulator
MTQKQKLYFIIQERRIVSLKDLEDITRWQRITILRAIAPLVIRRKLKAVISEGTRYFKINDKSLKNG